MARAHWGIDVSPTSLKAIKLEKRGEHPTLTEVDAVDFGISSMDLEGLDGHIHPALQDGLFEFSSRYNFDDAVVSTSLPTHTTFNRFTTLPPVEGEQTEKLVRHEAQQHIPFPLDDVIWDFQEIQREEDGSAEVILFAIKEEIVNEFLSSLKRAGIDPDIIQFSSVALYNFIQYDQPVDRTTAVLDLGANNCDLIIIEGERHWTRDIPVSANDFTRAIQDELNIGFEKAEQIKRSAGSTPDSEDHMDVLEPVYRDLVQEVHRSIGFYKSMSSGSTIDQVYLTGGGSRTDQLDEFISENMQLPVSFVSRLNKIKFSDDLDEQQFNQITMSIGPAAGLALQGMGETANRMNLMPESVVREKEFQRKKPYVVAAVAVFGLACLLYAFSLKLRYNIFYDRSQQLKGQQENVEQVQDGVETFQNASKIERFKQIGAQVNQSAPGRTLSVRFWDRLMRITPDNVLLRDRLNTVLLPYLKAADEDETLPESYRRFRTTSGLDQKWKKVQEDVLSLEKKFLFVLGLDHQQEGEQVQFDVYCGIFRRENREAGFNFIESNVHDPMNEAFSFQEKGISEVRTASQLSSPFDQQEDTGEGNFGQKMFRIWKVSFAGKKNDLWKDGNSQQE